MACPDASYSIGPNRLWAVMITVPGRFPTRVGGVRDGPPPDGEADAGPVGDAETLAGGGNGSDDTADGAGPAVRSWIGALLQAANSTVTSKTSARTLHGLANIAFLTPSLAVPVSRDRHTSARHRRPEEK